MLNRMYVNSVFTTLEERQNVCTKPHAVTFDSPGRRQRYIKEPLRFLLPNISAIPFIPAGPPQHTLSSLTHLVLPVFVFPPLTVHF
jgi:hypothetical protein